MKRYKKVISKTDKVNEVFCNRCGKQCVAGGNHSADFIEIDIKWGYYSGKDGEHHNCDICEKCYDEIIKDFKFKPKIDNYF